MREHKRPAARRNQPITTATCSLAACQITTLWPWRLCEPTIHVHTLHIGFQHAIHHQYTVYVHYTIPMQVIHNARLFFSSSASSFSLPHIPIRSRSITVLTISDIVPGVWWVWGGGFQGSRSFGPASWVKDPTSTCSYQVRYPYRGMGKREKKQKKEQQSRWKGGDGLAGWLSWLVCMEGFTQYWKDEAQAAHLTLNTRSTTQL